jgi:hypothetical protein
LALEFLIHDLLKGAVVSMLRRGARSPHVHDADDAGAHERNYEEGCDNKSYVVLATVRAPLQTPPQGSSPVLRKDYGSWRIPLCADRLVGVVEGPGELDANCVGSRAAWMDATRLRDFS